MCSRKWLMVALVACGLASACSEFNTNLSVQTSASVLSFVSPSTVSAGAQGFTITANGAGFVSGALILWNGTALTTTFVSGTQLTAPVPASNLTTPGTVQIAVDIPGSAVSGTTNPNTSSATTTTEISNVVLFTIGPAPGTPPAITSLSASTTSQASTPYCSPNGFTLTVNGTNLTSDAMVNWNGSARATTFVSATQLTAAILAADSAFPGTASVTVTNSLGGSNSLPFTLSSPTASLPVPVITSLSQTSAAAGSPAFTLGVQGTVLPCTVAQWTDANHVTTTLATTYVAPAGGGAASLSAVVPAADLLGAATTQTAQVSLSNLGPGGDASLASLPFTIVPPTIASLSSSTTSSNSTPSCSTSGFTLTVNGANFVSASVVNWNSSARPTTFVNSTQLTAVISAADIASAGSASVTVSNYAVNSAAAAFTVGTPAASLPAPAITILSPASATAGTAGFTLSVNGSSFVPCSIVQWNGGGRTTTYVNPTQLQIAVTTADIASVPATQPAITVVNPAPGGGTSNAVSFSIVAPAITSLSPTSTAYCGSTGMTLTVNGTNFVDGLVVNWNGSPRLTTFVNSTRLAAAITAADTASLGAASITVSNSAVASNSASFSMTAPTTNFSSPVIISSLSPANAAVETAAGLPISLTVNGTNLLPCFSVLWNGASLPTTVFVAPTGITTLLPALNISAAGQDQVTVITPTGGTSGGAAFTVYTPGSVTNNPVGISGALTLALTSADQRYAVSVLSSTDGVTEIPGTTQNIFVHDTCTGAPVGCTPSITLESIGFNSNPADGNSSAPSISADGRYVAFLSVATNLVSSDTNGVADAFVRDTCAGAPSGCTPSTQRVSVATGGTQADGASTSATISATGRYITFESSADNLAASSASGIFLRDTCAGVASGCTPSTQPLTSQSQ